MGKVNCELSLGCVALNNARNYITSHLMIKGISFKEKTTFTASNVGDMITEIYVTSGQDFRCVRLDLPSGGMKVTVSLLITVNMHGVIREDLSELSVDHVVEWLAFERPFSL